MAYTRLEQLRGTIHNNAAHKYCVFIVQADWTSTHTSLKDTEQSTIEASITLDGVTLTDPVTGDHRINYLQFAGRYQCLPIRCSGRLISLQKLISCIKRK
jgi:hypothetical protein